MILLKFCTCNFVFKFCTRKDFVLPERNPSQYLRALIQSSLETCTLRQYDAEVFKGTPQLFPHHAEYAQSLYKCSIQLNLYLVKSNRKLGLYFYDWFGYERIPVKFQAIGKW